MSPWGSYSDYRLCYPGKQIEEANLFLGHFAVALASKPVAPRTSLGWLVACSQLPDFLFPALLTLGSEKMSIVGGDNPLLSARFESYPFSHSLAMNALCGAAIGLLYWWRTRYTRGAWVLSLCVVGHWLLDMISHLPDMPLWPGGPRLGLGLWRSVTATVIVEVIIFGASIWLYGRATHAADRVGRWAFAAFVAFLALLYIGSLWGPPPENPEQFAWVAPGVLLFPVWAWWLDRHRTPRAAMLSA